MEEEDLSPENFRIHFGVFTVCLDQAYHTRIHPQPVVPDPRHTVKLEMNPKILR